ncbi:MAG: hypothetical protein AB1894_15910 [Chloroflexota bacterium]
MAGQPPPLRWQGKFDQDRMTELLRFLEIGGFFDAWNPGEIDPAADSFRMGANLETTQVQYEGGDPDPPLYHQLVETILPSLTPLSESGHIDERIAAILREAEDCRKQVLGMATPGPASTSTSTPEPTLAPSPTSTQTRLPSPQTPAAPVLITPTTIVLENGLTWTECAVPFRSYAMTVTDMGILKRCVAPPEWSADDEKRRGERVLGNSGFIDLRITIGSDDYESKLADRAEGGSCHYELFKNGEVLLKISADYTTYDPNISFWNIGGNLVWELAGRTPVIIVNGANLNEEYHLEGSYFPYEIKGKLIYISKKNEKYRVVYDEKTTGPEFDEISMAYCCSGMRLFRGSGQYWFVGSREGVKYLVSIQ